MPAAKTVRRTAGAVGVAMDLSSQEITKAETVAPEGNSAGAEARRQLATVAQEAISVAVAVPRQRVATHPVIPSVEAAALAVAEVVPLGMAPDSAASVAG